MPTEDPLQRYQVMEPLGRGGQGHTFRGIDRDTGRDVAIKVLSLRQVGEWKAFDLFEREVAVLRSLDHPGIPRYIDSYASEQTGDYFLVMELIDGTSLGEYVGGRRRLPPGQLREVLDQLLDILAYLHGSTPPVVHRDIKPANLVLDREGHLHLVDFGGVRKALQAEGGSTVVGTFGYMAPEQLYGEATPASDLYAVGATIAALLSGVEADRLPHDGLRIDVDRLEAEPRLQAALRGMLEPEPAGRLGSVKAVREALGRPPTAGGAARAARPRPDPGRETALAPVSPVARRLARVGAPWSILVWIASALGAGFLIVAQVVLLPLVHHLVRAWYRRHPDPAELEAFEGRMREVEATIRRHHRALSHVADHTRPALGEGNDHDEPA